MQFVQVDFLFAMRANGVIALLFGSVYGLLEGAGPNKSDDGADRATGKQSRDGRNQPIKVFENPLFHKDSFLTFFSLSICEDSFTEPKSSSSWVLHDASAARRQSRANSSDLPL